MALADPFIRHMDVEFSKLTRIIPLPQGFDSLEAAAKSKPSNVNSSNADDLRAIDDDVTPFKSIKLFILSFNFSLFVTGTGKWIWNWTGRYRSAGRRGWWCAVLIELTFIFLLIDFFFLPSMFMISFVRVMFNDFFKFSIVFIRFKFLYLCQYYSDALVCRFCRLCWIALAMNWIPSWSPSLAIPLTVSIIVVNFEANKLLWSITWSKLIGT